MATVRTSSILKRLTIMNMLVSTVALLLACAGFFAYDQVTFRQDMVRTASWCGARAPTEAAPG